MSWDILGNSWAVDLLKQHAVWGSFRQAYLFTGAQGVGRRTLALRLVQALNCLQPVTPGEPCRVCRACIRIEQMQHPDLIVVQAEQIGGTLKVDQIRELQRTLALAPYEASYKVALMLRFEEAHVSAQNAFLKTLEEPPDRVVLIITAESAESLLPTVVSRCEVVRLRPVPLDVVYADLQLRWGLASKEARLLAHLSGGRPGYALRLHNSPRLMEQRRAWLDDHSMLLHSNRLQRFDYAEKLAKDRVLLRDALQTWLSLWRDAFLQASGSSAPLINLDRTEQVDELVRRYGLHTALSMVSRLKRTLDALERYVNPRLATEVFFLDLPRA